MKIFCSSWLSLSLPKNLQVLICSVNNPGPGSNHMFSLESKSIHLLLGASRQFQIFKILSLEVQSSIILFTPKRVNLYLVIEFQCTFPQVSGKGTEFSSTFNFIVHTQIYFFKATSFTKMPSVTLVQFIWQVRKNLCQPTLCCYVTHLGNSTSTGQQARLYAFNLKNSHTLPKSKSSLRSQWILISMTFS